MQDLNWELPNMQLNLLAIMPPKTVPLHYTEIQYITRNERKGGCPLQKCIHHSYITIKFLC